MGDCRESIADVNKMEKTLECKYPPSPSIMSTRLCEGVSACESMQCLLELPISLPRLIHEGVKMLDCITPSLTWIGSECKASTTPDNNISLIHTTDTCTFEILSSDVTFVESTSRKSGQILHSIKSAIAKGTLAGISPQLTRDGSGGTYIYKNETNSPVAVFKPSDEEPYAPNNPRGYTEGQIGQDSPMRSGIAIGEAAIREVAAFLLDRRVVDADGIGFFGIPLTVRVMASDASFRNPDGSANPIKKMGSLQEYVQHSGCAEDYGPSIFPLLQVQKLAVFDMLVLNLDRNESNILVAQHNSDSNSSNSSRTETMRLIPIDHGFILPSAPLLQTHGIDVADAWCWLHWPQAQQPLDPQVRSYILDHVHPSADAAMVQTRLGLRPCAARSLCIAGTVLREGALAGHTLHRMATDLAARLKDDSALGLPPSQIHTDQRLLWA